jgi:hypothetical protein
MLEKKCDLMINIQKENLKILENSILSDELSNKIIHYTLQETLEDIEIENSLRKQYPIKHKMKMFNKFRERRY